MSPAPDSRSFELSAIQSRVARILEDLHHPPLGMAAALSEECGEVSALLLDHHAYGKPLDLEALAGELVDVLVCLCEIATHHGAAAQERHVKGG